MNYAVLTGDLMASRQVEPDEWIHLLKDVLSKYGQPTTEWMIYRGDSFQLETTPEMALTAAIHIKSAIKTIQHLDVRMAIGIGTKTFSGNQVTESNGTAYQHSGDCYESLQKRSLAIKTGVSEIDEELNLYLRLACLTMDSWAYKTALTVKVVIENPGRTQKELEKLLHTKQSGISASLKRSGFEEIDLMIRRYKKIITNL